MSAYSEKENPPLGYRTVEHQLKWPKVAKPKGRAQAKCGDAGVLPEVHRPPVHADGEMHEVVKLHDHPGVGSGNVEERGLRGHPDPGEELEHRVGRLE